MSDQGKPKNNDIVFIRQVIVSVIFIPIIVWLLCNAYQKNQMSGVDMTACANKCSDQGAAGYDFKWPMLSGPKCTCLTNSK